MKVIAFDFGVDRYFKFCFFGFVFIEIGLSYFIYLLLLFLFVSLLVTRGTSPRLEKQGHLSCQNHSGIPPV
jgi:hypothetical protein